MYFAMYHSFGVIPSWEIWGAEFKTKERRRAGSLKMMRGSGKVVRIINSEQGSVFGRLSLGRFPLEKERVENPPSHCLTNMPVLKQKGLFIFFQLDALQKSILSTY